MQRDAIASLPAEALQSVAAIKARLDVSAQVLRSTAAMLMLNRTVQRDTWHHYQQNLAGQGWPPGMMQIGYAQRIASGGRAALNTAMQADSIVHYQIHPTSDRGTHAPILFVAPEVGPASIGQPGFDLLSASTMRHALETATDTGAMAFHAVQIDNKAQQSETPSGMRQPPGATYALLVLPLFPGNAVPSTVRSRQQQVIGYVFALLKMDEVLKSVAVQRYQPVQLIAATDLDENNARNLYRTSARPTMPLDLFGSHWLASVIAPREAIPTADSANAIAISGAIISALLFAVLRLLASITHANHTSSKRAFHEICQLQNQLSALIACSDHAMLRIDRRQRIMTFNRAAETMFGITSVAAINMTLSRFLPHRLKGAQRLPASGNLGSELATYNLRNVTQDLARRHTGERFPFEATIFKSGRWGQCAYLILLKDLTNIAVTESIDAPDTGAISQQEQSTMLSAHPLYLSLEGGPAHVEIHVGDSVCDATLEWLNATSLHDNRASRHTLSEANLRQTTPQVSQPMSIKAFINNHIHIDDRAAVKHQWKNAFRTGSDVDCVYRMRLLDGSEQQVRHWMTQAAVHGTTRQFIGVVHRVQHTTAPIPAITVLPANDAGPSTQSDDRRRWQPGKAEAGRLYQQLQCRIMTFESAREAQQKHLAREMHDDFGQLLTAMKMDLIVLQGQLTKVDHRLSQQLGDVSNLVDAMVISVRRIIANLPPQTIDQHGLVKSLELMAQAHTKRHRTACRLQIEPRLPALDEVIVMPIYRIVQEALNNVAKHAHATEIEICIGQRDEALHLSVSDNGTGITETALKNPGGFGLISMRERIGTLNGKMVIDTTPGSGTTIRVVIPIDLEMAL